MGMLHRTIGAFVLSVSAFSIGCASDETSTSTKGDGSTETGGAAGTTGSTGGSAGSAGGTRASGGASGSSAGGKSGGSTGGSAGGHPGADSGTNPCSACSNTEVCVEHETQGGALILADAGRCPNGRVPVQSENRTICETAPSYECAAIPATCNNPPGTPAIAHCVCARSLCGSANLCTDVSPTLMKCTLQAP
jgi:hypothetical protein